MPATRNSKSTFTVSAKNYMTGLRETNTYNLAGSRFEKIGQPTRHVIPEIKPVDTSADPDYLALKLLENNLRLLAINIEQKE